jgi:DNA helicase-2/ATP-dependent DNA helicase PcrA
LTRPWYNEPVAEEKKLNLEQKEAVEYGEGPLLIIAGAGTGKTTVITERIKYLVSSGKAKTSEILALTFTDKAAREMEERVDMAMPYGYTDMWISTFHSFCDRILRQEALQIGLNPGYKLMNEAEMTQFLINNLFKFDLDYFRPLGNPTKFVGGMLQHFSRLKDEDVEPEQYLKYARKLKTQNSPASPSEAGRVKLKIEKEEVKKTTELAQAYETYEKLKVKEGVMDFADLISQTLRLFRTRNNVLQQYQKQFKYLLVDEFQDTNFAQNELAMLLAGPPAGEAGRRANITVTGDDDQSIYRFRGAAVSNIIQFRKNYPEAKIVVLVKNYRSTQMILDQAYQLIQQNNPDRLEVKEKIDKKLKSVREEKGSQACLRRQACLRKQVEFIHTDRVENEAEIVAKKIRELTSHQSPITDHPYSYSDIAILVRANNHAEPFVRALARAGIPYQFLGPGQLFRQAEVKDLIAYLKVLYDIGDDIALFRVLSMEHFDLSARDLAGINSFARKNNLSLFEACEKVDKIFVSQKTKDQISWFIKMVYRHLKLLPKETAGQILYYFLEETGLLRKMAEYKTNLEEKEAQNISSFFDRLKTYEVDHEDASVRAVVDWLNLSMEMGESPLASNLDWTVEDRVNLLTVHSAKGLEFPVIFLVNLVAARFPTRERREQIPLPEGLIKEILPVGDYHEQEERRLFYVGMTRACDQLFLTAANYYGEAKREKKISPFVIEALGEEAISEQRPVASNQLTFLDWQKPEEDLSPVTLPAQAGSHRPPITYLSYSQIDTFDTCPRQYRFRYIQRIPVPPSAAASLGSSIHQTLRDFYQEIKDGQKMTKKDLLKLLEVNWLPQGYTSKAHEERMKKQGQRMLTDFYKQFDAKLIPRDLEQPFIIRVSPKLKIGGKIDRVDEAKGKLEIIDYKTGKVMEQKDVDQSLQMTVYALAAADKGIYGKKPEEVMLTFYFLDKGEKKFTKRTPEQLEQAKKELLEKGKEIEKSGFEPKPSNRCEFCDFKLLCEAWR